MWETKTLTLTSIRVQSGEMKIGGVAHVVAQILGFIVPKPSPSRAHEENGAIGDLSPSGGFPSEDFGFQLGGGQLVIAVLGPRDARRDVDENAFSVEDRDRDVIHSPALG